TQNIQDDFVRVYPNPTSSILNIETKYHKIALCEIRNLQGQIVSHQTYSQSIDIQNLTDGVYFILLLDNNQKVLSRKLVVKE
ncbi:MAG TPA: T9SS type A sorting domain-containing protein, partial [Bacteroidia bacterium]|nr:T9SS type A sorting domain-containing protein [Bacteroidia bacterium]